MWFSGSGYSSSLTRSGAGAIDAGSRSIILGRRCAASRSTALPKPHSTAPASDPPRSRSRICAPRVRNHTPFSGVRSESDTPWTRASALAPARDTSSMTSPVVACAPWPSSPTQWTTPLKGRSRGSPSTSPRHESRRSASTDALRTPGPEAKGSSSPVRAAPARTTVWLRAASRSARSAARPSSSAARIQEPGSSRTSAGPFATITPLSIVSGGSDSSTPRTSTSSKPELASARRHTAGPARA